MKSKLEKEYWRRLIDLMLKCKTRSRMDEFLHLFFTMNEREFLIDRYKIVEALLTTPQTQREIAKGLEVSITKITDGSKAVQIISDPLRTFLIDEMKKGKAYVKAGARKTSRQTKS